MKDVCAVYKMISSGIFYIYAIVKVIDVNKEKKRTKN